MKKWKICIGILMLVTTLSAVIINVSAFNLATLDYQEDELISMPGNVNLEFDDSDTGKDDIDFLWRIYNSENNITIYLIKSGEIIYDNTFVNDTKNYTYFNANINNSTLRYVIKVDYSSIEVPLLCEDIINKIIADKDAVIASKDGNISKLVSLLDQKNKTITEITHQRDNYKSEIDSLKLANKPLQNEITTLKSNISLLENKKEDLINENYLLDTKIELKDRTIMQLSDPWCYSYSYYDVATLKNNSYFYFNWFSFLIGIAIISIIVIAILKRKTDLFTRKKTIAEKTNATDLNPFEKLSEETNEDIETDNIPEFKEPKKNISNPKWQLYAETDELKTWGYDNKEIIKAKRNDGFWRIVVDGKQMPYMVGSDDELDKLIVSLQENYKPPKPEKNNFLDKETKFDIGEHIDKLLNDKGSENVRTN